METVINTLHVLLTKLSEDTNLPLATRSECSTLKGNMEQAFEFLVPTPPEG